jgi:hypothetical protein
MECVVDSRRLIVEDSAYSLLQDLNLWRGPGLKAFEIGRTNTHDNVNAAVAPDQRRPVFLRRVVG